MLRYPLQPSNLVGMLRKVVTFAPLDAYLVASFVLTAEFPECWRPSCTAEDRARGEVDEATAAAEESMMYGNDKGSTPAFVVNGPELKRQRGLSGWDGLDGSREERARSPRVCSLSSEVLANIQALTSSCALTKQTCAKDLLFVSFSGGRAGWDRVSLRVKAEVEV